MRVVKAHTGGKILTSIVQDSLNNIKPASNSTSESDSDSDRVERFVESRSNYSELNDSGDQALGLESAEARSWRNDTWV